MDFEIVSTGTVPISEDVESSIDGWLVDASDAVLFCADVRTNPVLFLVEARTYPPLQS